MKSLKKYLVTPSLSEKKLRNIFLVDVLVDSNDVLVDQNDVLVVQNVVLVDQNAVRIDQNVNQNDVSKYFFWLAGRF